jgi:putative ATP-dependent endonuclease of the OLD family
MGRGSCRYRPIVAEARDLMRVVRLTIDRFRGIKSATLDFTDHTLLVGGNNVGKSTVCEALNLVLGPDRLSRFPPIEEYDFYNAEYLEADKQPPPLRVEVLITDLSAEVQNGCGAHLEFWHEAERRILQRGEIALANAPPTIALSVWTAKCRATPRTADRPSGVCRHY